MESAGKSAGSSASKGFGSSFKAGVAGVIAGLGLAKAAGAALAFAKDSVAEARESQKVGAVTAQIIKSTGGAAKITAGQVGDLATAISNKTGVDDEAIQSGANMLLTFKNVKNEVGDGSKIFDRATQAAADLSAAGFGDMAGQSKMLGKALNDPIKGISALSRSGVTFTDQQKEQIKTLVKSGKTLDAQKIILGEVESQVGGTAAASATAGEKLATTWGNFKEGIGTALLPTLDKLETFLSGKVIPGVQKLMGAFGKSDKIKALGTAVKDFYAGLTLKDAGDIGAPLEGFVATGQKVRKAFDEIKAKFSELKTAATPTLDAMKDAFGKVWGAAKELWPSIKDIATQLYDAYTALGISSWQLFKKALEALPGIIETLGENLSGVAKWMGENKTLVGSLVTVLGTAFLAIKAISIATKVWAAYTKAYAAAQVLLNVALTANPIGIVVVAIAALVAGLIYAYQTSETFRSYVSTAFSVVKIGALSLAKIAVTAFQFLANVFMTVVGTILDGAAAAFGWVPGLGPKLQGAASQFNTFKTEANKSLDAIKNDLQVNIDTEQANIALEALHREFLSKGWTVTAEVNTRMTYGANGQLVPTPRATGGPVSAGGLYAVGDNPDGSWNRTTELFVPKTAGNILTQSQIGAAMGDGGLYSKRMHPADLQALVTAFQNAPAPVLSLDVLQAGASARRP